MCFPGKRQKRNFAEPKPERKDAKAVTVEPIPSSGPVLSAPSPLHLEPTASEPPEKTISAPRVAIVIYSLYGHIAKRMSFPMNLSYSVKDLFRAVAEAVKSGVNNAGGSATIYQ